MVDFAMKGNQHDLIPDLPLQKKKKKKNSRTENVHTNELWFPWKKRKQKKFTIQTCFKLTLNKLGIHLTRQ